ncbi:MAG: DNA mismatch repair endonuclease MutL [Flavobacteriaceae bacterium]
MTNVIKLLPDHVANQIAAGEVVQRPSSVVKELLENSIDANSTDIKLFIKNSGKTLIQVVDNGKGMSFKDARMCFERHATSKISSAKDLFSLNTKGFRGEALSSIAAISHVELKTKTKLDKLGSLIKIEGSEIKLEDSISVSDGTSLAVKNLFFNIPARRNFLKSDTVELRHIIDEFHRVVLAHPKINFSMFHNGNDIFDLRSENFRQRIIHVFGNRMNEKLVPVDENTELLKISGFVGKPEFAKKSRGEQFFFVNQRFIKSSYLNHAVISAFDGLLAPKKIPSYFLNLSVDPNSIDINIHPTKTEIKFDDEPTLYALLRAAVKHSLGQFNIAPVLDFERNSSFDTPYSSNINSFVTPKIEVDPEFNPFNKNESYNFSSTHSDDFYIGINSKSNNKLEPLSEIEFESNSIQSSIFDNDEIKNSNNTFQLLNKYILCKIKSGLMVVDQNRAHQRVLYEGFLKQFTLETPTIQNLLFPLNLNLTSDELKIIKDIEIQLKQTGFSISEYNKDGLFLNAIPVGVKESNVPSIFEELISDIKSEVPNINFSYSDLMAKLIAKSLATQNGKKLTTVEQEFIVNSLFACKEPNLSPSNKRIFITIEISDLDSKFN